MTATSPLPLAGDNTRRLLGPGSGFFPMFNRNKQSLAVDITDPRGREIILKLVATADIFLENFRPGGMAKPGRASRQSRLRANTVAPSGTRDSALPGRCVTIVTRYPDPIRNRACVA